MPVLFDARVGGRVPFVSGDVGGSLFRTEMSLSYLLKSKGYSAIQPPLSPLNLPSENNTLSNNFIGVFF